MQIMQVRLIDAHGLGVDLLGHVGHNQYPQVVELSGYAEGI